MFQFLSADLTQNTALPRLIICIRLIERIITDITAGANSIYLDSNFEILQVILKCILNGKYATNTSNFNFINENFLLRCNRRLEQRMLCNLFKIGCIHNSTDCVRM